MERSRTIVGQCPLPGFTIDDLEIVEHQHLRDMKWLKGFLRAKETKMKLGADTRAFMYDVIDSQSQSRTAKLYFRDGSRLSIVQDIMKSADCPSQASRDCFETAIDATGYAYGPHLFSRAGLDKLIADLVARPEPAPS